MVRPNLDDPTPLKPISADEMFYLVGTESNRNRRSGRAVDLLILDDGEGPLFLQGSSNLAEGPFFSPEFNEIMKHRGHETEIDTSSLKGNAGGGDIGNEGLDLFQIL